jgi:magnesium-protoporphyrin IX monomethyl ester (oxidative) cyclase
MFLGIEAIDAEGLDLYRKRISPDDNFRALEAARRLGITVAITLIVDPAWDAAQFRLIREFATTAPEIVHLTVMTPYPGTEAWHTESRKLVTRDYRLFDIQHAVVPTTLPLEAFYRELILTQRSSTGSSSGCAPRRAHFASWDATSPTARPTSPARC